jgi:SPP1 family predicted phage head-tail adaptor
VCAELQRKIATRTAAGGTNVSWLTERDVFCSVKGLSADMKLEAGAREPQITHEIIARQENDIDATKRLLVGTRTFMIDGIPEDIDERHRFVRIMAVEGVAT